MSGGRDFAELETPRLRLVPYAPEHLLTLIDAPARFAERFGYPVADELRAFFVSGDVSPAWLAMLRGASSADPWVFGYAIVHVESAQVIGSASFKGAPDANGAVEIAYGVVPSFERKGYATEAAAALLRFAFADDRVRLVLAHTAPRDGASPSVLRRLGFAFVGEVEDPEDGLVWRWERQRDSAALAP